MEKSTIASAVGARPPRVTVNITTPPSPTLLLSTRTAKSRTPEVFAAMVTDADRPLVA